MNDSHRFLHGLRRMGLAGVFIGGALSIAAFWLDRGELFRSWLIAWLFFLGIALGSMANLMLHELTGGAWGFAIHLPGEGAVATLPLLAVLGVPLFLGLHDLYPWARDAVPPTWSYLAAGPFALRAIVYFALWIAVSRALLRYWRMGATNAGPTAHPALRRLCVAGLLVYALTMTLAAVDWIMSLSADWYSTTFGLVVIVGQSLSGFVFGVACAFFAEHEHNHSPDVTRTAQDLGNLLLTLAMLWAYLAFTQFLIIWAEDLPPEAGWYAARSQPQWRTLAVLVLLLQFAVPLTAMLFRAFKRRPQRLAWLCVLVLAAHWGELLWLIAPQFRTDGFALRWTDFAATLAIGGGWLLRVVSTPAQARPLRAPGVEAARHG